MKKTHLMIVLAVCSLLMAPVISLAKAGGKAGGTPPAHKAGGKHSKK